MSLWVVARLDWARLNQEDRGACIDWITSLGEDPTNCRLAFAVSQDDQDRSYRLHLTRYVLADGKKQIDHAADDMWTEPVVIPIPEPPAWLLAAYQKQLTDGGQ